LPKYLSDDYYIGSPVSKKEAGKNFNYIQSKTPYFITQNIAFLGEIKENYGFEKRKPIGFIIRNNEKEDDLLFDDSALAVRTKRGVVVVTGCSHSGICNIVATAKTVFNVKNVYSVIGGFHLRGKYKKRLTKTVEVLKKEVNGPIYPAHCSDFKAKCFLAKHLRTEEVFVSKIIKADVIELRR